MAEEPPRDLSTLAAKIDYLFETVHPAGRGPYSYPEVAAAIQADGEVSISTSFIYALRTGKRGNVSLSRLRALAKFFGVDPNFFFDEGVTRAVTDELEFVAALRDSGVRGLAMRAAGLSPVSLEQLRQMAEHVRRLEGLPAVPSEASGDEQSGRGQAPSSAKDPGEG